MIAKLINQDFEKNASYLVIGVMVLLPLVEFFMSLTGTPFFWQETIVHLLGMLSVLLLTIKISKEKKIEIYLSDILLATLFLFAILSLIFTKDMSQSFANSRPNYREDIGVYFSYYSTALLASRIAKTEYRSKIIRTFYVLGIVEIIVGILQYYGLWMYAPLFDPHTPTWETSAFGTSEWAFGFTEHFNFFAALVVVFTALSAGKYLICEKELKKKYLLMSAFCFYGIMTTYTRIGWLGCAGFLCFLALLGIIAKKLKINKNELNKKGILILTILYLSIFVGSMVISPQLAYNIEESIQEAKGESNFGNNRMNIWTQGLATVPEYWYIGTGLDNYRYSFFWDGYNELGWYQDKGHNEYIHILVTQGVFAITTWFILIFYNLFTASKRYMLNSSGKEETEITFVLLVMYGGYLCQALANSSVTNVAIYSWMITGLLLYTADKKPKFVRTFETKELEISDS